MLLSYHNEDFQIPHTSTCVIHTTGDIRDGDIITITSPIFTSTNYKSKAINMSDRFDVPVKLTGNKTSVHNSSDDTLYGTLVCNDNDVFNMFVRL